METFFIRLVQFLLSLSFLIIIHEGGHFLFARLFKTRVEKFCIFFDPWFTIFKFKPRRSETTYALGWLPLGGYCKISGMIDESMDTEQMKLPPQPWEFRSKPAWQRLFIMIGGVLFNFILAMIIYSMILLAWGESYVSVSEAPMGMDFNQTALNEGFQNGDVLLEADGQPLDRMGTLLLTQVMDAKSVTVLRGGQRTSVAISEAFVGNMLQDSVTFASFRFPFVLEEVTSGSPAQMAGLQKGDSITAISSIHPLGGLSYSDFRAQVTRMKESSQDRTIHIEYFRSGTAHQTSVTLNEDYMMGVAANTSLTKLLPVHVKSYNLLSCFPAGIRSGWETLEGYVAQFKYVFTKEGAQQLGGFGTIGSIFPASWDWYQFWYMTAFLSIILAFMNILPIPALDGGHVLFLLYEIIFRRKPSDKFLEYAQITGMAILFGLLIWANLNDVIRFLF